MARAPDSIRHREQGALGRNSTSVQTKLAMARHRLHPRARARWYRRLRSSAIAGIPGSSRAEAARGQSFAVSTRDRAQAENCQEL